MPPSGLGPSLNMLMNISIETLTGMSFELRVSPAETVMSVKFKIQRAEGIPVSQQHLIWQNNELDDHRRLRDYSIRPESTLRLVLGLRGGPLNAPRIPPIRLAPIQFNAPISPSVLRRNANNRFAYLSRFPIPAFESRRLPSTIGPASAGDSFTAKAEPSADSEDNIREREISVSPSSTKENQDKSTDLSSNTSAYRLRMIQAPISSTASAPSLVDDETISAAKCADNEKSATTPVDHIMHLTSRLDSLICDKSWCSKNAINSMYQSSSMNAVNLTSQSGENNEEHKNASIPTTSSTLDYPPLITPNSFRSTLTRFDLPSYWRVYEPQEVAISRVHAPLTSLSTTGSAQTDSMTSGSSVGAGHDPTSKLRPPSEPADADEGCMLVTTTTTASNPPEPTAGDSKGSMLTGLLSTTAGDHHLTLPYKTSGTEHTFTGHLHYPFHWLRHTSPFSGDSLIRGTHLLAPGDSGGDCEPSVDQFNATELNAEAEEEDEDSEYGNESVEEHDALPCPRIAASTYIMNGEYDDDDDDDDDGDDDDDSLADLEDYLFYYRTGDLLFGPPSLTAATCAPYYYTTLRDSCATDLWRDLLEGSSGRRDARSSIQPDAANLKRLDALVDNPSSWRIECKQLADKVNDLKIKMKDVRSRRQNRHCNTIQLSASEATSTGELKDVRDLPVLTSDAAEAIDRGSSLAATSATSLIGLRALDSSPVKNAKLCGLKTTLDGRRQRRFGTVTPPQLDLLTITKSQVPTLTSKPDGSSPELVTTVHSSTTIANEVFGTSSTITKPLLSGIQLRPLSAAIPPESIGFASIVHRAKLNSSDGPIPETMKLRTSKLTDGAMSMALPNSCKGVTRLAPYDRVPRHCQSVSSVMKLTSPASRSLPSVDDHSTHLLIPSELVANNKSVPTLTSSQTSVAEKPPGSPPKPLQSPGSLRRKRCTLCLRKTGLANSYSCRCGRNFCSRHRYAELHACPFDYKAEARRTILNSNPVITAPKLPKF